MIRYKKVVILLLIGLLSIISLINIANAKTLSITVPTNEQITQKIDLAVDDHVLIQFTVLGIEDKFITFSLVYPNMTEIIFGEVGVFSHSFVCDEKGEYMMLFVNNDLNEGKLVTLNYEIEHYIFGMPQMLFITLLIVVFCVAMIAFYFMLSPSL